MVHFQNLVFKKGLFLVFQRPNRILLCSYTEVVRADFDWNVMTLGSPCRSEVLTGIYTSLLLMRKEM